MLERLSSHTQRDEVSLRSYTRILCDWKSIVDSVDDNFYNIYTPLSSLFIGAQAETCSLISQSISNKIIDVIRNNFQVIIREHKIDLINPTFNFNI